MILSIFLSVVVILASIFLHQAKFKLSRAIIFLRILLPLTLLLVHGVNYKTSLQKEKEVKQSIGLIEAVYSPSAKGFYYTDKTSQLIFVNEESVSGDPNKIKPEQSHQEDKTLYLYLLEDGSVHLSNSKTLHELIAKVENNTENNRLLLILFTASSALITVINLIDIKKEISRLKTRK